MRKPRNPYPGVPRRPTLDRHGKPRWRLRKQLNGQKIDTYLPGPYGSPAFRQAYEAAIEGARLPIVRTSAVHGSLSWLIENYLRSPRYKNLSNQRRDVLRRELDWIRKTIGECQICRLQTRHIEKLMDKKPGPSAANTVKKNMSLLFNFAIKYDLAGQKHNAAKFADRRKENPDGFHTWTSAEIAQFLTFHGRGSKARLAALLIMNTGSASQDVSLLGRQNVDGGRIRYHRHKTDIGGDYQILPELAEELQHVPSDRMLFITQRNGAPYKAESFGRWFKERCKEAGLPHCSPHGLRKGQATRIAEEGGTELEVMSFLAHATPAEGATNTKRAGRAKLADRGLARVLGAKPEQNLSNPDDRLDKDITQPDEKKGKK